MRNLLFAILLTSAAAASAQVPKGFAPVPDEAAFRKGMSAASASITSIKSDFVQEKNLSVLDEKIVSKGRFLFRKPDMVRMQYTTPFSYLMVINKAKVTIRDGQKTNTFSARGNKMFEYVNRIIIGCVQGTAMDNKDFTTKAYASDKQYLLVLVPKRKEMAAYFSSISIYAGKKDYAVQTVDMTEPSGDNTTITFNNRQFNAPIPDEEFVVR